MVDCVLCSKEFKLKEPAFQLNIGRFEKDELDGVGFVQTTGIVMNLHQKCYLDRFNDG